MKYILQLWKNYYRYNVRINEHQQGFDSDDDDIHFLVNIIKRQEIPEKILVSIMSET